MAESFSTGRKHCGNGEIARLKQFLLFQQCFQKTCSRHVKTKACLGKDLKKKDIFVSYSV